MKLWLGAREALKLSAAVRLAWPEVTGELAFLGEGFSSVALESENGFVVLIAKDDPAVAYRRKALALMPQLARHLSVSVPVPVWSVESAKGLPLGAFAYQKVKGRPLEPKDANGSNQLQLARQIGKFLLALHSFPANSEAEFGLSSTDELWEDIRVAHDETMPFLATRLQQGEMKKVELW